MHKLRTAIACASLMIVPTSALAMTGNDRAYTQDRFFKCDSLSNLWHVISTGRWAFYC